MLSFDGRASRFAQLIKDSPAIAHYVRDLLYEVEPAHFADSLLPSAFQNLTKLRKLNLTGDDWLAIPSSLRSSLLYLIHLPTIDSLDLGPLPNLCHCELLPCTNVKVLSLCFYDDDHSRPSETTLPTLLTKPIQPEEIFVDGIGNKFCLAMLKTHDSQGNSMLNFNELKEFKLRDIDRLNDLSEVYKLVKNAPYLERISISGGLSID